MEEISTLKLGRSAYYHRGDSEITEADGGEAR